MSDLRTKELSDMLSGAQGKLGLKHQPIDSFPWVDRDEKIAAARIMRQRANTTSDIALGAIIAGTFASALYASEKQWIAALASSVATIGAMALNWYAADRSWEHHAIARRMTNEETQAESRREYAGRP